MNIIINPDKVMKYEKELVEFQKIHPYDIIPPIIIRFCSEKFERYWFSLMRCYPYNETLTEYKHQNLNTSPIKEEELFISNHPEWDVLCDHEHNENIISSRSRRAELFDEFMMDYDNKDITLTINKTYLSDNLNQILSDNTIVIPPFLLRYIKMNFPERRIDVNQIIEIYKENKLISISGVSLVEGRKQVIPPSIDMILLFEVAEFALTYPEYEDVFIEEIVE